MSDSYKPVNSRTLADINAANRAAHDAFFSSPVALARDAIEEYHVQLKAKHEGREVTMAVNVKASTQSEAESKARAKIEAGGDEFVRVLSARSGPGGYGS